MGSKTQNFHQSYVDSPIPLERGILTFYSTRQISIKKSQENILN